MESDSLILTNDPAQVERVQREVETILQAADMRMKIVWAMNVALGEWLENIIHYDAGQARATVLPPRGG